MLKIKKFLSLLLGCSILSGCGMPSVEDTIFAQLVPQEEEEVRIFYGNKNERVNPDAPFSDEEEEDEADDIINAFIKKMSGDKEDGDKPKDLSVVDLGIDDFNFFSTTERSAMFEQMLAFNSYDYATDRYGGATLTMEITWPEGSKVIHTMHMQDDCYYYTNTENEFMCIDDGEIIGQDTDSGIKYPYKYLLADGAYNILFDAQKVNVFPIFDNGKINKIASDGKSCVVWETFTRAQLRENGCFLADYMGMSDTLDVLYKANSLSYTLDDITIYINNSSGRHEFAHGIYDLGRDVPEIPQTFKELFDAPGVYSVSLYQDKGSVKEKFYSENFPSSVYVKIGLPAGYYKYYADEDYQYPVTDDYHSGKQTFYTKSPFAGSSILYTDLEDEDETPNDTDIPEEEIDKEKEAKDIYDSLLNPDDGKQETEN